MKRRHFIQAAAGCTLNFGFTRLPFLPDPQEGILIKILGTAQDGGLPQLGCSCDNCRRAREQSGFSRRIASLAIIDLGRESIFLVDATPDIRSQWVSAEQRLDRPLSSRAAALKGVLLTHAHIGHYTGLIFLGYEAMSAHRLPVYCSPRMAGFLKSNGPWSQLVDLENISLCPLQFDTALRLTPDIAVTPFPVPHRDEFSDTLGFWIRGQNKRLLYIPDIQNWKAWQIPIREVCEKADIAVLDGTFFSPAELPGRDLSQIGHPFIINSMQELKPLVDQKKKQILFTHLNHSNPAVDPESQAYKEIVKQGFAVAAEGQEFIL
jgi:pyrroloquinoline quinone biosynthesis protein B